MLLLQSLPSDIIKEIVEGFNPARFVDRYTLKQLRLVNRVFSTFATSALFRTVDTIHLGEKHEELISHVHLITSSSSNILHRIKKIDISRRILIPSGIGVPRLLPDSSKVKTDLPLVIDAIVSVSRSQIRRLLAALGPEFRFSELSIGPPDDGDLSNLACGALVLETFMAILPELVCEPAFSEVKKFHTTLYPGDVGRLVSPSKRVGGPVSKLSSISEPVVAFLRGLQILEVEFVSCYDVDLGRDYIILGNLLRASQGLRTLVLDLDCAKFEKLFSYTRPQHFEPITILEDLTISYCGVDQPNQLHTTLDHFPNLKRLHINQVEVYGSHRWERILKYIEISLKKLVSVLLETLMYFESEPDLRQKLSFFEKTKDGAIVEKTYDQPIFTPHRADINALRDLLRTVKARRDDQKLEKDLWLSKLLERPSLIALYYD